MDSTPVKGVVYINGKRGGNTPFSDSFEHGSYEIKIQSDGFEEYTQKIELGYEGESILAELIPSAQVLIPSAEELIESNLEYEPDLANEYLSQGKEELKNNEFISARNSVEMAIKYAKDVDGDGVPNDFDIQPKFWNPYIYGIPLIILIIVIAAIFYDYRRCNVDASVDLFVKKYDDDNDYLATVDLVINNRYKDFVCSVYLDGKSIENVTSPGYSEIILKEVKPGSHTLRSILLINKKRYGTRIIEKELDFDT